MFDKYQHEITILESMVETVLLSYAFLLVWKLFYSSEMFQTLTGRGSYVLMIVYASITIFAFEMTDSFRFGNIRISNLIISQIISIFLVNFVAYLVLCLMANVLLNVWPTFLLQFFDSIICFLSTYFFSYIYHKKHNPRNMLMVYTGNNATDIIDKLNTRPDKYKISHKISTSEGLDKIFNEINKHPSVIINDVESKYRNDILKYCYGKDVRTYVVPKISDIIISGSEPISLFDTPIQLVKSDGLNVLQSAVKRLFDIILSLIALIITSPIMLIVCFAIKLEDGGPVFFKQSRITKDEKTFEIYKFRSMTVDAEKGGYTLEMRAGVKDPRITKVGNLIRACRIDELPQIINILKGDMSIVGPRPERVENHDLYKKEIPEWVFRTKVKGGLTGYAQIYGKYNTSPYDKTRLDLMYIENYSLMLDIKLIFMTLQILTKKESTEGFK